MDVRTRRAASACAGRFWLTSREHDAAASAIAATVSTSRPRDAATLGVDYFFQDWGVTPELLARVALPAAFQLQGGLPIPGGDGRNVVLLAPNQLSFLPEGADRRPVLTMKATAHWDLGAVAGVLAELFYVRDPNQTLFVDDETGQGDFVLQPPDAVGVSLLIQARF